MQSSHTDMDGSIMALIRSRQHLETNPENAGALFEQGIALCQLGQWEKALDAWDQVAVLEPDNAFAHLNRGIVHLQQEQWLMAEQAFADALRCRPEQPEAHFGLGVALAQQGRYEAAHIAWQETLLLDPAHSEAQAHLAMLTQMSATEVESLNFGSAQVLQFDCIAASTTAIAVVTDSIAAPTAVEPVFEKREEPRIKLPPLSGPPLEEIAGTVIAAHEARSREEFEAPDKAMGSEFTVKEASEPTLRLDSKALKREHARRRSLESQHSEQGRRVEWNRHLAVAGVTAAIVALTLWGRERLQEPVSASSSSSTSSTLPSVISSASSVSAASSPLDPAATSAPPVTAVVTPSGIVVEPAPSTSASGAAPAAIVYPATSAARPTALRESNRGANHSHSGSRRNVVAKSNQRRHADEEVSHAPRRQRDSPTPALVRTTNHRSSARTDEDTFATHHRAGRAENAEEWTDHIP